jgi:hypothetical protein
MSSSMKQAAVRLSEQIGVLNGLFKGNTLNWEQKPGPDKWSAKQVVGHLIDSANNNIQRFVRGTYDENFKVVYQQNEWVRHQHYDKAGILDLMRLWTLLNMQMIRIWENYPEDRLLIKSDVGGNAVEEVTMQEIAKSYVDHMIHHIEQIKRVGAVAAQN